MEFLTGKKTFIAAVVSVIAAWVGVWAGTVDIGTAWQMTQAAILGATIRSGITSEASKVAPKPPENT